MKPSIEQIGDLLALKRDERPENGYWGDFLCEFHHRQRVRVVEKSSFRATFSHFSDRLSDFGPSKWAYGAGVAYAALTIGFILAPRDVEVENPSSSPVNYQVVPAPAPPVEQLNQLDLSPSTQGDVGEQIF